MFAKLATTTLDPDLLVCDSSSSTVSVLRGLGGGKFAPAAATPVPEPRAARLADLDQDGRMDAVTANLAGSELRVSGAASGAPTVSFRRGDADLNGAVQLTDAVTVLLRLFAGGQTLACDDAADADDGGSLDLTDAVRVLSHLFRGGPAPPDPGPDVCGPDPTADDLTCESSNACP